MSRYTAELPNGRHIAWGYDPRLQEYFLTEFWSEKEVKEFEDIIKAHTEAEAPVDIGRDIEVVFSIMSHTTTALHPDYPDRMHWGNGDILELMERYPEISEDHKLAIALDQPF